jgi:hypothetical protein
VKENYAHISIVLDRSGSMKSTKDDTIGGFNQFIEEQNQVEGQATVSLAKFDHEYTVVYQMAGIGRVQPLTDKTFVPRGQTALLDAIGTLIDSTGLELSSLPEEERPAKVVFVIITDGQENASYKYNIETINQMIQHQADVYNWQFVFLGADQDAITDASTKLGIASANVLAYSANTQGIGSSYSSLSRSLSSYRIGATRSTEFTKEDRKKQEDAGLYKPENSRLKG